MFTHTLRKLGVAAALVAFAMVPATLPASAARSDQVTVFKGRFVCDVGGVQVPLEGADVSLFGASQAYSGLISSDQFFGVKQGATTGAGGEFRFEVPFASDGNYDYYVQVALAGRGDFKVREWPSGDVVTFSTGTNQNDVPAQDYHTQLLPNPACGVWLAFEAAAAQYKRDTGQTIASWGTTEIGINYGGPNRGDPWTDYLRVNWPRGYAADSFAAEKVAAAHELAHLIRNFGLRSQQQSAQELTGFDFVRRRNPCTQTGPALAFYDGWAEFWAGDYAPAPNCPGVAETDYSVEGMVAWRLARMERICVADSRKKMDEVLENDGRSVHSLQDFASLLPPCEPGLLDPSRFPSYEPWLPVPESRYAEDLRSLAQRAGSAAARISAQLGGAGRAAALAHCPPFPCARAIAAKAALPILAGGAAQDRLLQRTALALASTPVPSGVPSASFLESVLATPTVLRHGLATVGVGSLAKALAAAAPLAHRDRSPASGRLIANLERLHHSDAQIARGDVHAVSADVHLQFGSVEGTYRTHRVQLGQTVKQWLLTFGGLPSGTAITNQVHGATFGSAQTLAFRGPIPGHGCAAPPIAQHGGPALAPTCPMPDTPGYVTAGTLVRLDAPALTVSVRVGVTNERPGSSIEASLNAFEANGDLGDADATVVHSDATGLTTLTVKGSSKHPIAYVAIFSNGYWQQGPNLVFDVLHYTSR